MRNHEETKLTIAVADYLRGEIHKGRQVIRVGVPFPDLLWTMVANEGRSEAQGAKFKRMGVRAGVADFLVWHKGIAGAIELKSETGKQSPHQHDFECKLTRLGHKYAICRHVWEVRDTLVCWGLECKNTNCIEPAPSLEKRMKAARDFFRP